MQDGSKFDFKAQWYVELNLILDPVLSRSMGLTPSSVYAPGPSSDLKSTFTMVAERSAFDHSLDLSERLVWERKREASLVPRSASPSPEKKGRAEYIERLSPDPSLPPPPKTPTGSLGRSFSPIMSPVLLLFPLRSVVDPRSYPQ